MVATGCKNLGPVGDLTIVINSTFLSYYQHKLIPNTMSDKADSNIKGWFDRHSLPWSEGTAVLLEEQGVECVEDLKLLERSIVNSLFESAKPIIKTKARLAWQELGGKSEFEFKNAAKTHPISPAVFPSSQSSRTKSSNNRAIKENNLAPKLTTVFNFSRKVTKRKEDKIREREERKKQKLAEPINVDVDDEPTSKKDEDDGGDDSILLTPPSKPKANNPFMAIMNNLAKPGPMLALEAPNYRTGRCELASTLEDPADEDEKSCWVDVAILLPSTLQCEDLEDPDGHYKALGCTKTSSDEEIAASFKKVGREFRELARHNHTDKTSDKAKNEIFFQAKEKHERQKRAHDVLGTLNILGTAYPDRVNYDRRGEGLRKKFKEEFDKSNPEMTFADKANEIDEEKKRQEVYAKGQATRAKFKQASTMERVIKSWNKQGHQDNIARVAVRDALQEGKTRSQVAHAIRLELFSSKKEPWDGVHRNDSKFKAIYGTLGRIVDALNKGTLRKYTSNEPEWSTAMKSKSIKPGARGRRPTSKRAKMETLLLEWMQKCWKQNKAMTRGLIFRRAMLLDGSHCGGKFNPSLFNQLKKWFYGGFKSRAKLSRRKHSSVGQKLPKNWQDKAACIVRRVANAQMPTQRGDGSFCPGVTDDKMGNTDQVPIYIEMHQAYGWGDRESHERRMVSTAGKEKDRFTVQLTVFKSGRKVCIVSISVINARAELLTLPSFLYLYCRIRRANP